MLAIRIDDAPPTVLRRLRLLLFWDPREGHRLQTLSPVPWSSVYWSASACAQSFRRLALDLAPVEAGARAVGIISPARI